MGKEYKPACMMNSKKNFRCISMSAPLCTFRLLVVFSCSK